MKKTIYFWAALPALATALALAGCSKTPDAGVSDAGPIRVAISTDNDWTSAPTAQAPTQNPSSASAQGPTRGTPVGSEAEMTDFGLFCAYTAGADWTTDAPLDKMFNERMVKSGSPAGSADYWTYASGSPVLWEPSTADDRYTFFAYAPYATTGNGISVDTAATLGIPTLTYTVPADNTLQPDLMVAIGRENVRPTGSPIAMHMTHALTAVGFEVNGTGSDQISTISITGVSTTGTLAIDGRNIQWHSLSAPTTTTNYTVDMQGGTTTGPNNWLMMIPQTLTTAASVTITFSDGTAAKTIPLDEREWLPGHRLTYTINI